MTAAWGGSLASPARPQFVPSARLSVGWVSAWLQERRTQVASATLLGAIVDLRLFARAAYPNLDWRWMARLEAAVRQRGGRARDKRQLFRNVAELVELGETLMRRSGLMITLLALRPLRLQNFTALTLHQSLRCQGDGWWIVLPEEATKNRRPLELPFPDRLVPALEHYLARVRPLLLEGRIERGQRCRLDFAPRDGDEPSERLRADHHANRPGLRPPGHPPLFRDCAATSMALADPALARAGASLLGHASFATTERHYNLARAADAARGYHAVVRALRAAGGKQRQ